MSDRNTVVERNPRKSRKNTESWASDVSIGTNVTGTASPPRGSQIFMQTGERREDNGAALASGEEIQNAKLVLYTSFGSKVNFSLVDDKSLIGRKDDNHVHLKSDPKISKHHAMVERGMISAPGVVSPTKGDEKTKFYLRDRNSSNGVKLNGVYITPDSPILLSDGDNILIGSVELVFTAQVRRRPSTSDDSNINLVTILPSKKKYEETVTIRTEIEADEVDFKKSVSVLREDYEKLRLAYELSKFSLDGDITALLEKSLDMLFEILPVDRGVVLLVDQKTKYLGTHYVKLREGKSNEGKEILLSSTIIDKVYYSRICLITSDACEDPQLGKADSVRYGQIRSVICVPLIANNRVHGILHLDSRDRYTFSQKDLSLVKTISNQTAMAIENNILIKEVESKARIQEQLSRFLAPHVVDRMVNKTEMIKRGGGRLITGTIIFVDIRGFTKLSEKAGGPSEVVDMLNDYFERLVKCVFKYDGVVDKYIGDALMAVFGTLEDEKEAEFRAVGAALEFITAIAEMNEERARARLPKITIGVGVNTGELVAGFIGCSKRLEYTCIGDTVNTSSRICDVAEPNQVLISETTYEAVKDRIQAVDVGGRMFKGKEKEVRVYEALGLTEEGKKSARGFTNNAKTLKYF